MFSLEKKNLPVENFFVTVFIRYEDMIYNYQEWLDKFLSAFYLDNSSTSTAILNTNNLKLLFSDYYRKLIYTILYQKHKNDFKTKSENLYKHKRRIASGNYKTKLSPETIEFLNQEFRNVLISLGYEI